MAPCYPAQLKDPQFTPEEVKAIWEYSKTNYIDKGVDFDTTIKSVADDLGMRSNHIALAFTKPKALRPITNEIYRRQSLRRDAIRQAKMVVRNINAPGYAKLASKIYNFPRSALTFGHWAVFPVTHAGDLVFRPTAWKSYFKGVFDAYRFAGRAAHEAAMQDLVGSENYIIARRGGLVNDPQAEPQGILTSMSGPSRRGFDALKIMRQKLFDREWAKLKPEERTVETSKEISEMVNHSTGAYTGKVPLAKIQFAPQLTASKWARAIGDPIKTIKTFSNWKNASAAERAVAHRRVVNAAEFAATYAGFLAVNQGLNMALGSKDQINFSDPTKGDWLQFKIGGHIVGMGAGVREVYRLLGGIVMLGQKSRKELRGGSSTAEITKTVGRYAMYKLEPTLGNTLEAVTGEDRLTQRPLPFSNEPGTSSKPKMSWTEYGMSHFVPIPLTGATREAYDSMRERGLSAADSTAILKAAGIAATEATGMRNYEYKTFEKPAVKGVPNLHEAMKQREKNSLKNYLQRR
jgi:hypothetical protein